MYRVPDNPNVPNELKSLYASEVVRVAQSRAAAQERERAEERRREQQKRENFAAVQAQVAERKRLAAERAREVAQKNFENFERSKFFARNPAAVESDWSRNRQAILDRAMLEGNGRGLVGELIRREKAGGQYGNI